MPNYYKLTITAEDLVTGETHTLTLGKTTLSEEWRYPDVRSLPLRNPDGKRPESGEPPTLILTADPLANKDGIYARYEDTK